MASDRSSEYCFIGKNGEPVTNLFSEANSFSDGIAWVRKGIYEPKWRMLNTKLELSESTFEDEPEDFSEGLARNTVYKPAPNMGSAMITHAKYTFIDKTGQHIFPKKGFVNRNPTYDVAEQFSEGLAWVIGNGVSGFIDHKGKVIINQEFDTTEPFSEGLSLVKNSDGIYFIDQKGEIIISTSHNREPLVGGKSFQEGIGAISVVSGWYLVNRVAEPINYQPYSAIIEPFTKGVAKVANGPDDIFYIDKKGRRLFS